LAINSYNELRNHAEFIFSLTLLALSFRLRAGRFHHGGVLRLRDGLDITLIALLYLIPLGLITAYWGLGPGITSAVITFLAFIIFSSHRITPLRCATLRMW